MAETINLTDLTFNGILDNLKEYLTDQSEFSDYDFEGSGLSVLLNLLAYNTYYDAYLANMLYNETLINNAKQRSSVVNRAKHLGYTPTSYIAPTATISIQITSPTGAPAEVSIPIGTEFTTTIDSTSYTFVTTEAYTAYSASSYIVTGITIKEGYLQTYTYVFDSLNNDQRFFLPEEAADTTTLTVTVQNSETDSTSEVFTLADDINELDGDSSVYWIQETNGKYEVIFGDDVLGKKLTNGNLIILQYVVTNGETGNGVSSFSSNNIGGGTVSVTTTSAAAGGAEKEDIESIRFRAPRNYQSQNRAVTTNDFQIILPEESSLIDSVMVWGGEDNVPPVYGKVYLCIKPASGSTLSDTQKQDIIDIINTKNVLTITPVIVDPVYMEIVVSSNIKYNPDNTSLTDSELRTAVKSAIQSYDTNELGDFENKFRYSALVQDINEVDSAILSNITRIFLKKTQTVNSGVSANYTLDFGNAIYNPDKGFSAISSNSFAYLNPTTQDNVTANLEDDGDGNVIITSSDSGTKLTIVSDVGSINYQTGVVTLTGFNPVSISNNILEVTIIPSNNGFSDLNPKQNQILRISSSNITVTTTKENS